MKSRIAREPHKEKKKVGDPENLEQMDPLALSKSSSQPAQNKVLAH